MQPRYCLASIALLLLAALLAACGGSKATDTPPAATVAPTTAANAAVATGSSTAGVVTRPVGSAVTAVVTTSTSPVIATVATGSAPAITGTRPAGSAVAASPVVGGTVAAGSPTVTGPVLFTDPKGRFTFARPAAWTIGQPTTPTTVVQFNAANPLGVVDISTQDAPGGITVEKYRDLALIEIKKDIPDAQEVGTIPLQLGGEQAIQIDYTGTASGTKIYFSQIFAIHKSMAYILTLGTQPPDIDRLRQQATVIVQTWKFLQ